MFCIIEKYSKRKRQTPTLGAVHAFLPHNRAMSLCGRLITGAQNGWRLSSIRDTTEDALVTCRICHVVLRLQGETRTP
jgi:hypothetical protein